MLFTRPLPYLTEPVDLKVSARETDCVELRIKMISGGCDLKLCLSLHERHHMITTRRRTLLAPVFALSLIGAFSLTACSGEDTPAEPSTTTVTSAPSSESETSEPETTTVTSAPEDTPPPPTTVTSTPEPTQPSSPVAEEDEKPAQQAPANQPRATSPAQKQPPMGNQGASPNCPAYLCGYGTAPNGAPNLTSGETQLLARCNSGDYNAPQVCANLRLKAQRAGQN